MRRSRGFTLIEALFSMLIFSIVLAALAYSLAQLSRVSLSRQDFGKELEALQIAQLMRTDAANASQVAFSGGGMSLTGQNYRLPLQERLDLGLADPRSLVTVNYREENGWLVREPVDSSGSAPSPLASVKRFEVENDASLATVTFALGREGAVRDFRVRIALP